MSRELPQRGETWVHCKGGEYTIVGIAFHSETHEELVVYENSEGVLWARPLTMFLDRHSSGELRFVKKGS